MKKLGSVLAAVLVCTLVIPAHAATSGSSWSMEETSGTTMLDSTGTNNGTLHGVSLGQPGRPGSTGLHAYGFDGTTSFVLVPNNASLNPGAQDFSFTAWLKLTGTPGIGNFDFDIIRKGGGWKLEAYPHNGVVTAQCVYSGSAKVNIHAPQINGIGLDDHAWHVVTCARNAFGETLTVDGSVVATSQVQVGTISNTDDVYLGAQQAGVDYYFGLMDDVSFTIGTAVPPTITSFSPPSGPVGTPVTINGTGFIGASDVGFNGLSVGAGNFTVNSSILITATVPAGATNGLITVVAPGGTATSATSFTVTPPPPPIPNAPDSGTYGVNGRVNAIVRVGNVVFIGGTFTAAVAPNGSTVPRLNLAAIDTTTGQLTSFDPEANGEVDALTTDGLRLFVGGAFTTISGQPRHGFAAYSAALTLQPWTLDVAGGSASIGAFAISGSTLYLGGNFSTLAGLTRKRLASVNIAVTPPTVLPWQPSADKSVRAIAPLSNGDVVVGGVFSTLNGVSNPFLGEIRPDGSVAPWATHPTAQVWFVIPSATGNSVFVAAGGVVPEGQAQSYAPGGTLLWATPTDGGVQAVTWDATDGVVIFGGHFRLVAGVAVPRLCALDPSTGALDTSWVPNPNSSKGVWAVYASPDKLYAGGDFTTMGTSTFNHFAQFSI